jgi:hypothetical protein
MKQSADTFFLKRGSPPRPSLLSIQGTGVTVQAMAFGNMGTTSGTGKGRGGAEVHACARSYLVCSIACASHGFWQPGGTSSGTGKGRREV